MRYGETYSSRLVDCSQDGNASSGNATPVDACRNSGRHLEEFRVILGRLIWNKRVDVLAGGGLAQRLHSFRQLVEQIDSEK
jgi:hypothetical protein